MYKSVDPKADFPKQEEEVLAFWEKNDTFKKSVSQREGAEDFTFYDGPPFATGLPHFGHFIPSTIKDIIPRYQTMKGKKVTRRFGWDCHGLPVGLTTLQKVRVVILKLCRNFLTKANAFFFPCSRIFFRPDNRAFWNRTCHKSSVNFIPD